MSVAGSSVWADGGGYPLRVRVLRAALVAGAVLAAPIWLLTSWASQNWTVALNLTDSLGESVFLVDRATSKAEVREQMAALEVGDRIAFRVGEGAENGSPYRADTIFVKEVAALPGERVGVADDGWLKVEGHPLSLAKEEASDGRPLEWLDDQIIPPGHVFAWTPHPDSYDSRYAEIGLIAEDRFVGTAFFSF